MSEFNTSTIDCLKYEYNANKLHNKYDIAYEKIEKNKQLFHVSLKSP